MSKLSRTQLKILRECFARPQIMSKPNANVSVLEKRKLVRWSVEIFPYYSTCVITDEGIALVKYLRL